MSLLDLPARLANFLRAGYPRAIAGRGFVPLIALCRRRLSDEEVSSVASELTTTGNSPIDGIGVRVAITKLVDDLPSLEDIQRVNQRLVDNGWSVTDIFRSPD